MAGGPAFDFAGTNSAVGARPCDLCKGGNRTAGSEVWEGLTQLGRETKSLPIPR